MSIKKYTHLFDGESDILEDFIDQYEIWASLNIEQVADPGEPPVPPVDDPDNAEYVANRTTYNNNVTLFNKFQNKMGRHFVTTWCSQVFSVVK